MNNNVSNQVQRGRLFAVKITAGQEKTVATFINIRLQTDKKIRKYIFINNRMQYFLIRMI